ncbi:transposase [Streptomyces vastus]|uniref:Probable transposase IS891/IS1136/IS1341 domain-containing protein n=1 Tax=Streptomyces vastus TaxID=285451 RepID=A0ABN3QNN6_9ACTN
MQERRDAYRHVSKTSVRYGMQSAQLKDIRAFDPERQGRCSFSSQQATLRRLDKAFAAFFRRVKSGDTPGYPRFRGVNWFDTVDFPKDGDGCRWNSTPHDPTTSVRRQDVGHVKVNQHRAVAGRVKTVSVNCEGRRWFVVLTAEQDQPEPLPATSSAVGIDLGIANFLADSNGEFVPNPRHGRKAAAKLDVKVNAADPGYTAADFNGHSGPQTATEGTDAIVELATIGVDGPTGTFRDRHGAVAW